jgi:RND family efflux transporter MFP subunit
MEKRKLISIFLILILIFGGFSFFSSKTKKQKLEFVAVEKGEVKEVVSESGTLKRGNLIDLSFEISGKIEKIFVKEGEEVEEGEVLAKLDDSEIKIQLKMAKAQLAQAQASLEKLLAGPKEEEIKLSEITLEKAKEDFENFPDKVSSSFDYFSVKLVEVKKQIDILKDRYFRDSLSDAQDFRDQQYKIEKAIENFEEEKKEVSLPNVKEKIQKVDEFLETIFSSLEKMGEIMEDSEDMRIITQQDINTLYSQKEIVNSLIFQNLSLETNYNLLKSTLDSAQKKLDLLLSSPKEEDVEIYQSKVKEAEANLELLEEKLEKTKLKSPIFGKVVKIFKEEGERVEAMAKDIVLQILPKKNFEIEVDIYEEDITKVKVGDPVEITFPAIEGKTFSGKVIFIDPAEKIKDGVVYYGVKIKPENLPENVLPGMSCDLKIITQKKENILRVLQDAIEKREGKYFVKVLEKGKIKEKEIKVGLWGEDYVEILGGLEEGEKVVLP